MWQNNPQSDYWITWYRSNRIGPEHPRYRAPSQLDLGNFTTPAEPDFGTQNLTWLDSEIVGRGEMYTPVAADVGKLVHCAVSANNGGATVTKTASAPPVITAVNTDGSVSGTVPGTLSLSLGAPASFGAFTAGVARDYDASMAANVISTAGSATLSVADQSATATGHLVNGAFSLPSALQVRAASAGGVGGAAGRRRRQREPDVAAELRRAGQQRPGHARRSASTSARPTRCGPAPTARG